MFSGPDNPKYFISPTRFGKAVRHWRTRFTAALTLLMITAVLSATAPAQNGQHSTAVSNNSSIHQPVLAAGIWDFFSFFGSKTALAGNTLIVDNSVSQCVGATYTSIQEAVIAASDGDTIQVCAGTYNESVSVTKSLTINGPQVDVDAKTGRTDITAEAVVGGTQTIAFNVTGTPTVTINGFTISTTAATGDNPAVFLQSGSGHIISNNIFTSSVRRASYFSSPNTTFQNNRVSSIFDGFFGGVDNTTIQNNLFDGSYPDGAINTTISSDDPKSNNFKVLNNTFTTNSGNIGVLFATQDSVISGNTINNTGDSSSFFVGGGNDNLTIRDNTFTSTVFSAVAVTDGGFTYINPNIQYGNNSNISFINNTINRVITDDSNNFTTIDYRGVAGANRILNNSVTLTRATGVASGTSGYGIRLRGSASGTFNIAGNLLDGNSLQSSGTPSTSGLIISSNQPTSNPVGNGGQFPTASTVNANCNSFSNNQNGVAVYDFVNSTYGNLQNGSQININNNNFISNSPFSINNAGTSANVNATRNYFSNDINVTENVDASSPLTAATQCASVINAPLTATVDQMSTLNFNNIAVNDPDIDTMPLTVVLSVTNGTLSLPQTTGVTITNNNTSNVTLVGTIENVNTALSGLVYDPTNTYSGSDTLNITSASMGSPGAGSGLTQTSSAAVTISVTDSTAPTVSSITRATGGTNPTMATSVNFTVIFSEPVKGVDDTDFTVAKTGNLSGGAVSSVAPEMADPNGFTSTYTVTVSGFSAMSGNGTIGLNVIDDDTIIDVANIPLNGGFTGGETYTVLMNAPVNCDNDAPRRVYNVATEFSLGGNTNCEYTYGNTAGAASNAVLTYGTPIVGAFNTPGIDGWYSGQNNSDNLPLPGIFKNNNNALSQYPSPGNSVKHQPGTLNLHPGIGGQRSVLRFTVPTGGAGFYNIKGSFAGIDNGGGGNGGTTTDVLVLINGTTTLFSGDIESFNDTEPFNLTRNLADGDTVDFSVGYGANGNYNNDSTSLAATLTPVNLDTETLYGLTNDTTQRLVSFSTIDPNNATIIGNISGLGANEKLVGIDFRPRNRVLYGVTSDGTTGRVYTINPTNGAATAVSTNNAIRSATGAIILTGTDFGVDFNPAADRIRVISNTGQNLRVNPDTGLTAVDITLNDGTGATPQTSPTRTGITGAAYTNSDFDPTTGTTLYDIDTEKDALVIQNPPNDGVIGAPIGTLGVDAGLINGFDISSVVNPNNAYASFLNGANGDLYTINLTSGAATRIGRIGGAEGSLNGLSIGGLTAAPIGGVGNDGIFPTATIIRADANPTMAATVNFTVTFNEDVTGVDAGDFAAVTTGTTGSPTITVTSTSARVYNVAVTNYIGDGTVGLNLVDNDTIIDGSNNQLGGSGFNPANPSGDGSVTGPVYTVNQNVPYVTSITRLDPDPTNASSVRFQVTFSEAVTGVDSADFRFTTTGSVNGVGIPTNGISGSGTTYIVTVSIGAATSGSTLRLDVFDNDTIIDANGAPLGTAAGAGDGSFMTGQFYTIDKTPPTATIAQAATQPDPTNVSPVNFTVVFSETVTGFVDATDVTITGTAFSAANPATVTITPVGTGGTTYNVAVSGMGMGTIIANVPAGAAFDTANNPNTAAVAGDNTVTFDNAPPTATINQRTTPNQPDPTSASPINFTVVFNEPVTDFDDATDVTVTGTAFSTTTPAGTPVVVIDAISRDGTVYNVKVSGMTSSGTVIANVPAGVAIDVQNNPNTAATSADNTVNFALETLYALTNPAGTPATQSLITFSSSNPNVASTPLAISGVPTGETLVGIDFRPSTIGNAPNFRGVLYGISVDASNTGRVYTINTTSGAATLTGVIAPTVGGTPIVISGTEFGIDFNPVPDRIRLISNAGQNLRINPDNGVTIVDGALNPFDANGTTRTGVTGAAYNNNDNDPTTGTMLFDIDSTNDQLLLQNPPNNGTLSSIGALGVDVNEVNGFDISGVTTTAYAAFQTATATDSALYTVDLTTGRASLVGTIGGITGSGLVIRGLTTTPIEGVSVDNTAPTVTVEQAANQPDPTNAQPINFTVVFSEAVTGFTSSDVILGGTSGSVAGATATVTGSGTTYNIAVSGLTVNGTVTASVPAGSSVDLQGNPNTASTSVDNMVTFTRPTISITDVTMTEGNNGTKTFDFRVELSNAVTEAVTVEYATADGSGTGVNPATAGDDYVAASGTVTFSPGPESRLSKPVSITVNGDTTVEPDETFFVNLTNNSANSTISDNQGVGTITNDDVEFSFSSATYSVTEGTPTATITVNRNGVNGSFAVNYATGGGTATAGSDYTAVSGTLNFASTDTMMTFTVPITDDTISEIAETVGLALSLPTGSTATLVTPSSATLTINDNDSNNNGQVTISGIITQNGQPLSGVTVTLTGSVPVDYRSANPATTGPDGRYSFPGLPGNAVSPNNNYLVTPSAQGLVFDPLQRSYVNLGMSVTNANFVAYTTIPRNLRIVNGYQATFDAATVTVPVVLDSLGNETDLSFSLNYDSTKLSNPMVACGSDAAGCGLTTNRVTAGLLGIAFERPNDPNNPTVPTVFTAGIGRQVVTVTFTATPGQAFVSPTATPNATFNTPVTFGDSPTTRDINDADGNSLASNYINGSVVFAQGYEGDLGVINQDGSSTHTGNGSLSTVDLTVLRAFVSGTQTPDPNFNEFQRADVATAGTKGGGTLTSADITVLRNYITNSVLTPAGGPTQLVMGSIPNPLKQAVAKRAGSSDAAAATGDVRVVSIAGRRNGSVTVPITLDSNAMENGITFSLNYDQTKLKNPTVSIGSDVPLTGNNSNGDPSTALLTLNRTQTSAGRLGVSLALPEDNSFSSPGTKQVIRVTFDVDANAALGDTPVTFGDTPLPQELNNTNGAVLSSNFVAGAVNIQLGPTAASATVGGRVLTAKGGSLSQAVVTLSDGSGKVRSAVTNSFGNFRFENVPAGASYVVTVNSKRYSFAPQVVNLNDNLTDLKFTAAP